tara:strand:- start:99524 stop:101143 length:1620 start_codon:yes stop_codon:yes gene_type:complete
LSARSQTLARGLRIGIVDLEEGWPGNGVSYVPMPLSEAQRLTDRVVSAVLDEVVAINDVYLRRLTLFSVGPILRSIIGLIELAHQISNARDANVDIRCGYLEYAYLAAESDDISGLDIAPLLKPMPIPRWQWLRRIARINSWTPVLQTTKAIINPNVVAVTHNALLRAYATSFDGVVGFQHISMILKNLNLATEPSKTDGMRQISGNIVQAISAVYNLPDDLLRRLNDVVQIRVMRQLKTGFVFLSAAAQVKQLPEHLWVASAANPYARSLAFEALSRGSEVTSFDHGYNQLLASDVRNTVFSEMVPTTRFVTATAALAEAGARAAASPYLKGQKFQKIYSHDGATDLRNYYRSVIRQPKRTTRRPRVLFAPRIFRGLRQLNPASLTDEQYLAWCLRVLKLMEGQEVDVRCRAHPEGAFPGMENPLHDHTGLEDRSFEDLLPEFDAVVLDAATSTIFLRALVSSKPVIFLQLGQPYLNANFLKLVKRRCVLIESLQDENGMLTFDEEKFSTAVAAPELPDHDALHELRCLVMGDDYINA